MDKPKNPKLSPGPKLDNAPNEIKPIASKAGVLGTPKPMNDNVLQDDKVSVIPGQTQTDGKTGVVDVQDKKLARRPCPSDAWKGHDDRGRSAWGWQAQGQGRLQASNTQRDAGPETTRRKREHSGAWITEW